MRVLGIIFICVFLLMFLFAKVKVNESTDVGIFQRAFVCLIGSGLLTLVLGLPICGLIYLITS